MPTSSLPLFGASFPADDDDGHDLREFLSSNCYISNIMFSPLSTFNVNVSTDTTSRLLIHNGLIRDDSVRSHEERQSIRLHSLTPKCILTRKRDAAALLADRRLEKLLE